MYTGISVKAIFILGRFTFQLQISQNISDSNQQFFYALGAVMLYQLPEVSPRQVIYDDIRKINRNFLQFFFSRTCRFQIAAFVYTNRLRT